MFSRLNIVLALVALALVVVGVVRRYGPREAIDEGAAGGPVSERASAQEFPDFDPGNFDPAASVVIDNAWWPLKPGTRWVFEGYSLEGGERVRHLVVDTVTDLVKEVSGVKTVVILEEDYRAGELVEREIAFHAQDKEGNLWHLGQLSETYDEKDLVGGRAWLVGHLPGARAGIRMWADPEVGQSAAQGYAPPPFNWTDRGRVALVGQKTNVAAGRYEDVIVVEEWDEETPPGVFQLKYYARGVGLVRIGFQGLDPEREEVELTKVEQLRPAALQEARAEALKVEERGSLYGRTSPAVVSP